MSRSSTSSRLRICPDCGEVYSDRSTECTSHHAALLDWADASDTGETDVVPVPEQIDVGDETEPQVGLPGALAIESPTPVALSAAARTAARLLGGRYRLGRRLGVGGYGAVFAAYDERLDKRVAVKLLSPTIMQDPEVGRRFKREAIAASRVQHECVVDVTDFDVDPAGTTFFVMEYLDGTDLSEELDHEGPLSVSRALVIAAQCASALTATHAEGILHRDLKPANIFLVKSPSRADFVKIIDFGISKFTGANGDYSDLTSVSRVVGTPHYMPPEQARGLPLDGRADVYALGVILFEMLTDRRPFTGASALEILTNATTQRRVPPSTLRPELVEIPGLDALVLRAFAIDRENRFESMEAFGDAIVACLATIDPALVHGLPAIAPVPRAAVEGPGVARIVRASSPPTIETSSGEVTRAYQAVSGRSWLGGSVVAVAALVALVVFWARRDGGTHLSPSEVNVPALSAPEESTELAAFAVGGAEPLDAPPADHAASDVDAGVEEPVATDAAVRGEVTIRLTSSPSGAVVTSSRRGRLGETPLEVSLSAEQDTDELTVSHPGRDDEVVIVDRRTDDEVHVSLAPERTVKKSRARRSRKPPARKQRPARTKSPPAKPAARKKAAGSEIGIKDW